MSEADLIAALLLATLSLWLPPLRIQVATSVERVEDELVWWAKLRSALVVSQNLAKAIERVGSHATEQSSNDRLIALASANQTEGLGVANAVGFLHREAELERARIQLWNERASPATAASAILSLLPFATLLFATLSGLQVMPWLISSTLGWVLMAVFAILTFTARRLVQRLRQSAFAMSQTAQKLPVVSRQVASFALCISILIFKFDFLGVTFAAISVIALWQLWPRFQSQSSQRMAQAQSQDRAWFVCILAASLQSGLDWRRSVQIAAECCNESVQQLLQPVMVRMQWGVEPAATFVELTSEWQPIGVAISQAMEAGTPIALSLQNLASHWQSEQHSAHVVQIEKIAARTILPVTFLQLPAFLLVGVVPVLITSIFPMWEQFVSTGNPFS